MSFYAYAHTGVYIAMRINRHTHVRIYLYVIVYPVSPLKSYRVSQEWWLEFGDRKSESLWPNCWYLSIDISSTTNRRATWLLTILFRVSRIVFSIDSSFDCWDSLYTSVNVMRTRIMSRCSSLQNAARSPRPFLSFASSGFYDAIA